MYIVLCQYNLIISMSSQFRNNFFLACIVTELFTQLHVGASETQHHIYSPWALTNSEDS